MKIKYIDILQDTIVDGPGLRTSIYLSGCIHKCKNCHNKESWNYNNGNDIEIKNIISIIKETGNKGITITGGDPFYNEYNLLNLLIGIKTEIPDCNIWVYTGYIYDILNKNLIINNSEKKNKTIIKSCLSRINILVDGPFIEELKDENLLFRGSSNQRIIDIVNNKQLSDSEINLF